MFARPCRSVFVCLRCQSRLAEKSQLATWLSRSDTRPSQPRRRWQSAAVAVAEDVQDDGDDQGHPIYRLRSAKKYKGEKVWKPNPTANLGVPSLGKPAEVLLLNERDRPIPSAPAEADEGREGDVLTVAWSTENQSLSPEQLTKNIEHIRDQARQDYEKVSEGHRRRLRIRLQEGFSAKQLRSYVEQKQNEATKPWRRKHKSSGMSVKYQMVRYIFQHIWDISGSDTADTTEIKESETSREIVISSDVLEVLLLADNSSLKQICIDHKVRIDFFRHPPKVLVSGPESSVTAARKALLQLKKKVKKHSFTFGDVTKDGKKVDLSTSLAEMRQAFNVHITRFMQGIHVYYHDDTQPDLAAIRRHIMLAHRQVQQPSHCSIWPALPPDALKSVLLGLQGPGTNVADSSAKRFIASPEDAATPSMPQMSKEQKESFSTRYKSTREAMDFFESPLKSVVARPGLRVENTASFGQALVTLSGEGEGKRSVLATSSGTAASFASQIPLLAQFLARRKLWSDGMHQIFPSTNSSELGTDKEMAQALALSQSDQFKYELILSSAQQRGSYPRIKIQLVGADISLGLKQPLQIKAISAVLGERSCYMLLPGQAVDIRFESQILCDVYKEGKQSSPHHNTFLSQLAKFFNDAGSGHEPKFAPFAKFSIPVDLRLGHSVTDAASARDREHEYILESAVALDVASYRPPFMSKLCLDHIVFMGDDRGGGRQSLQLAEHSILSPASGQKTTSFASFFNSAYQIALQLGSPSLLERAEQRGSRSGGGRVITP